MYKLNLDVLSMDETIEQELLTCASGYTNLFNKIALQTITVVERF